jgi:glutamate/tyrosine decarboxylase-like PLP-dependent enzyme
MSSEMRRLLEDAAGRAGRYLECLDTRPVFPRPDALAALARLDVPLPETGMAPEAVLAELDACASPATVASAGPRYFGFVTGGALPAALAANWLAGAWDQNAFSTTSSPAGVAIEAIAWRWLLEVLRLPGDAAVTLTTGATMANFACLAAARGAQLARLGHDVEADGLNGAPPLEVIVGAEAHTVVYKALGLLGLGRKRVNTVPVDAQGRIRVDAIPALSERSIVCLQAGNVNSGAVDAVGEIARRAREAGAWVHVDGAFGLWARAAPARAHLTEGVELAHSFATDGHKWLNLPYDCGIAAVTDRGALQRAMAIGAAYLPREGENQPMDVSPESSRRARGVEVYAALRALGRDGVADLVTRTCRHAQALAHALAEGGCEILNEVCLNQVLAAFGDDHTTQRVLARIQRDGTCWCGGTRWQGRFAIRLSVSSWATTDADIQRSANAILACAQAEDGGGQALTP